MTLSAFNLTLEEVKQHLKVEHELENGLITDLTTAAIQEAGEYLNRDWAAGEYPAAVKTGILTLIASKYEHRGDEGNALRPEQINGLRSFSYLPGL
jgi:uncharacterized phage protein (predicted DNA packaging)